MSIKKKERILLVTPGYPSPDNLYNHSFVHQRVLGYKEEGLLVEVFSVPGSPYKKNMETPKVRKYQIDDVEVLEGTHGNLKDHLRKNVYDKILIHFAWKNIMEIVLPESVGTPLLIWVHGVEALSWKRRLFNLTPDVKEVVKFLGYIPFNIQQLRFVRGLIEKKDRRITFIFVSHWMKDILEKDTKTKVESFQIIPNVINENLFSYEKKEEDQRYHIFNVRPYHSKKYANDLMVETILKLKDSPEFSKLQFHLYGAGRLFEKTVRRIKDLPNVHLENRMLPQKEMAKIHKKCGILLMPTRQDAQGVSMCEAMSSGLVPVVSKNTAIPEFVPENAGYLCENPEEMANAIQELVELEDVFLRKSEAASVLIQQKCGTKTVLLQEIHLIQGNR
ncbi:MAG TPA: hypothetical protein DEF30_05850 [Proteiniclasticum sp.]|uniref:glycosyltransferase family 4 protein n=1 Tax=Proteiniclasticum sp. TaxID=2053595 RepID=UPI000E9E08FC|nr:glycosyltransferase family 4 protein [Proteiniclasticum sp.]HBW13324.1 hypothetical protein [Proteiniclasticum sp.]